MNIGIKRARVLVPFLPRPIMSRVSLPPRYFKMNSGTSSYNPSFGAGGNLGVAHKQMSQIPNLTLNDGNEIPLVRRLRSQARRQTKLTIPYEAWIWHWYGSSQQQKRRLSPRQRARQNNCN